MRRELFCAGQRAWPGLSSPKHVHCLSELAEGFERGLSFGQGESLTQVISWDSPWAWGAVWGQSARCLEVPIGGQNKTEAGVSCCTW